jgi:nitronate monooxygenase
MWPTTRLTELFGIRYPIVQAPMAGGVDNPALAAAVSRAGGLGSLGAGYLAPEEIRRQIRAVRALTDRPFAINLFVTGPAAPDDAAVARANARLRPFREELGLPEPALPSRFGESFAAQVAVIAEERVPVFSFTFGIPGPAELQALKSAGCLLVGTATSVAEGRALQAAGVDAISAQGAEAGGHRGGFLPDGEGALVGVVALVPQLADAVAAPVIAAGGIADGRGIAAALALGAAGVQLGTAFLRAAESGASAAYQRAIAGAADDDTTLTRAFSGRAARGLANRFTRALSAEEGLPPFPIQNALTRDIRAAAAKAGDPGLLSLWAGQAAALAVEAPAAEIVLRLARETEERLRDLGRLAGA